MELREGILIASAAIALVAFGFAAYLYSWVKKQHSENAEIARVGKFIRDGANVFLRKEYMVLARFCAVAAVAIFTFLP
ncbi:MAG: sodium/proton-translocating pyrophosphatase, partial [Clostridiales bacterium]|nr:sodium/proton-translocating pyrophosphatase [Clostridiales bacterium]